MQSPLTPTPSQKPPHSHPNLLPQNRGCHKPGRLAGLYLLRLLLAARRGNGLFITVNENTALIQPSNLTRLHDQKKRPIKK
jgi:hypothetical protein